MELNIIPWIKEEPPTEADFVGEFEEQELQMYHWSSLPSDTFAPHTHGYHKIICVVKGSIKFEFPTRHKTITLNTGDRLDLPAGVRHSALVGMDGVKCLEAHIY